MKINKLPNTTRDDNQGFVLVLVMVALVTMMVVGISSTKTTRIELQIAANVKFHQMAFYRADAGIYSTPEIIKVIAADNQGTEALEAEDLGNFTYVDTADNFFRQLMGFDDYDAANDLNFTYTKEDGTATPYFAVDVENTGSKQLAGGGIEFGSGFEGEGVGPKGGVAIIFRETVTGYGPNNAESELEAYYREVVR